MAAPTRRRSNAMSFNIQTIFNTQESEGMPTYLLDTNICIYIAKHNPPAVRARFQQHAANELAMSVITLSELRFGAEKAGRVSKRYQR